MASQKPQCDGIRARPVRHGTNLEGNGLMPFAHESTTPVGHLEPRVLAWDSAFFKKSIGVVRVPRLAPDQLVELMANLDRSRLDCVYLELDVAELPLLSPLLRQARIADIRVELSADVREFVRAPVDHPVEGIVEWSAADRGAAIELAEQLSAWSRFASDPLLATFAVSLYREWIRHAFVGTHGTLVCRADAEIVGLLTYQMDKEPAQIELLAVKDGHRGKGIGVALTRAFLTKAQAAGRRHAAVRTQLRNIGAIRAYERAGFRVRECTVVLHRWRDEALR